MDLSHAACLKLERLEGEEGVITDGDGRHPVETECFYHIVGSDVGDRITLEFTQFEVILFVYVLYFFKY